MIAPPVLALHDVSIMRGGATIVTDVSMAVGRGISVALIGKSGSGKTSILKCIAGLLTPSGGTIDVIPGARTALMFQEHLLQPWLTVEQAVELPLKLLGRSFDVGALLRRLDLTSSAARYPWELSGGMQRRVSLARTLVSKPDILLLDEPFYGIDEITRLAVYQVTLDAVQDASTAVVLVTHSIAEAILMADMVFVLGGVPSTIVNIVPVALPHPRTVAMMQTPRFSDLVQVLRGSFLERQ